MSNWAVIVPVGRDLVNEVTNPSGETNTTGHTAASGATVARSTAFQSQGAYSFLITPSSASSSGAYFGTISLTSGCNYYASFEFNGSPGVNYIAYFGSTACAALGVAASFTGTGSLQTINTACYAENSTTTRRFYITKNGGTSTAVYYYDNLFICNTASVTPFTGDTDNCYWQGTTHGSKSTAKADARNIGQVNDLYDTYGLTVRQAIGAGMPPLRHALTEYGLGDGATYQRTTYGVRTMTLMSQLSGSSVPALHSRRKSLINVMRAGATPTQQPFTLRYKGGDQPLDIDCLLDDGLGLTEVSARNEFPPIRLLCPDPFWREIYDTGASLPVNIEVANANFILQRAACGVWGALGSGLSGGYPLGMVNGNDGTLYVCGTFNAASGGTACRLAQYHSSFGWSAVTGGATSGLNAETDTLVIAPDGNTLYIGGNATTINGTTASYIAKYNISTSAVSAVGNGTNGAVYGMTFSPAGSLYAVGSFTTASNITACRIAMWNGLTWSNVIGTTCGLLWSQGATFAYSVITGLDGNIYVGGQFDAAGGTTASYFAKYNIQSGSWVSVASGVNGTIYQNDIIQESDGTIYIGGAFTKAGVTTASFIAKTANQTGWETAGSLAANSGINGIVYSLGKDGNGNILAGGAFTKANGIVLPDKIAKWNRTTWLPMDVDIPGSASVVCINTDRTGTLTIGFDTSGTASAAAVTTLTNNGIGDTYPILKINGPTSGSGNLWQFLNTTTGDQIYFNLTISASETVTLDLTPGQKSLTSSFRGPINSTILPGDNAATFRLARGPNNISLFCGDGSMTAQIWWRESHDAIDGSGN